MLQKGHPIVTITPEERPIQANTKGSCCLYLRSEYGRSAKNTVFYNGDKATFVDVEMIFKRIWRTMDRCIKSYEEANPVSAPILRHFANILVKSGANINLDAFDAADPDSQQVGFLWFHYRAVGSYKERISIHGAENAPIAYFTEPKVV